MNMSSPVKAIWSLSNLGTDLVDRTKTEALLQKHTEKDTIKEYCDFVFVVVLQFRYALSKL